jgi:hypothetical protein
MSLELYSTKFYLLCAAGGAMACGATHFAMTPVDVLKCRKQVWSSYIIAQRFLFANINSFDICCESSRIPLCLFYELNEVVCRVKNASLMPTVVQLRRLACQETQDLKV